MAEQQETMRWLEHGSWLEEIDNIGSEPWITIYHQHESEMEDYGFSCALLPNSYVSTALTFSSWDLSIGETRGCYAVSNSGQEDESVEYLRFGEDGIEPLLIHRSFYGIKPGHMEVLEEFRLFHNLYHDQARNTYIKITDEGEEEDTLTLEPKRVRVKRKPLRQFLAAKEMVLAVYFDIHRYSQLTLQDLGIQESHSEHTSHDRAFSHDIVDFTWAYSSGGLRNTHSRIVGKRIVRGMPREQSGIWPYEKTVKSYADFIIAVNNDGDPVVHGSDPEKLANYYGANPDAPHYLTPVFFRREALQKYYAHPERYTIDDGILTCTGIWRMRIDNNHEKYVVAYLGDLGRDLSHNEQLYWKSFNVAPDGTISDVAWKRGFLAEFADPERADLLFKYRLQVFCEKWQGKYAWDLFKPLAAQDEHNLKALRIPLVDDYAEFDHQVLALTKVLIDSLNEAELQKMLPDKTPDAKGIAKLEAFMKENMVSGFEPHIKFLRNLQTLRSTGTGHRKSSGFDKIAAVFDLGTKGTVVAFEGILQEAVALLDYLDAGFLS
jgi:hypothetical protein